jgi:hypothetical protein
MKLRALLVVLMRSDNGPRKRLIASRLMRSPAVCRAHTQAVARWTAVMMMLLAAFIFIAPSSQAQSDDEDKILKALSAYLASQKNISLSFDSDVEVITPDVQKIQFASSGHLQMSRPDKLRASRTGGYADVELVFDGKTITVYAKHIEAFAQVDAPGSIDQLVDRLRDKFSVALPGADLLMSNVYDALTSDVIKGVHIGRGVIDGVECEHLAFRGQDTDWQIWVEVGDRPIPRKYVITSKAMAGAPQYTLVIRDWKTDVQPNANAFVFTPPKEAKKVEVAALPNIDEVPPADVKGAKK